MTDILVEYDGMQCMSAPPKEVLEARRKRMKEKEERKRKMKQATSAEENNQHSDTQVLTTKNEKGHVKKWGR